MNNKPSSLPPETIITFLRSARNVEATLLKIDLSIKSIDDCLERLSASGFKPKPVKQRPEVSNPTSNYATCGGVVGAVAGFVLECCLEWNKVNGLNIILFGIAAAICIIIGAGIGAALGTLIGYITYSSRIYDARRISDESYSAEIQQYNSEKNSYDTAIRGLKAICNTKKQTLLQLKEIVSTVQRHLYATNILYDAYRDLPAICQLLQYFESGRVERLSEAYNQYEIELRFDRIITNLDTVVTQLYQIQNNQLRLRDAAQEIKQYLEPLSFTLNSCSTSLDNENVLEKTTEACSEIAETSFALIEGLTNKKIYTDIREDEILFLESTLSEIFPDCPRKQLTSTNNRSDL